MYDLVISIVTYNSNFNDIRNIVNIINSNNNLKIFLIIVDNGSKPKYFEELIKLKVTVISAGQNLGYGKANNLAENISPNSKYFLVLNPDIKLSINTIDDLFNFMEVNKNYGLVSPILLSSDLKYYNIFRNNFSFFYLLYRRLFKIDDTFSKDQFRNKLSAYNNIINVSYISGSFMFFNRAIFKKVEGFNNKFFMYFEDVEICDVLKYYKSKLGILKKIEVIHGRSRGSYKFNMLFIYHFFSWIYYKLYNRSKN